MRQQYCAFAKGEETTEKDALEREGTEDRGEVCPAFWDNFALVMLMKGERAEVSGYAYKKRNREVVRETLFSSVDQEQVV